MSVENVLILSPNQDGENAKIDANKNKNSKRPSIKLYVPKQRRSEKTTNSNNNSISIENSSNLPTQTTSSNLNKNDYSNFIGLDDPSIVGFIKNKNSNNQNKIANTEEALLINSLHSLSIASAKLNSKDDENLSNEKNNKKNEEDWFSLYTESGELLKEGQETKENHLSGSEEKKIDYFKFEPKLESESDENSEEENSHVIEIYDFPVFYKNENILNAFRECLGHQEFEIKWVDDTHCLGVFSNSAQASTALKLSNGLLKVRALAKATAESKAKAKRMLSYLKPYKARPQTTSFVASRLITASLGIDNLLSKEKLKLEKSKLDNARDKKKKDKEFKEAIWNGN